MTENPYAPPSHPADVEHPKPQFRLDRLLTIGALIFIGSVVGSFVGIAAESPDEGLTLVAGGVVGAAIYFVGRWLAR